MFFRFMLAIFLFLNIANATIIKTQKDLKADDKGVVFIFESKTCPYCKILKDDLNNNESLNKIASKFNIYSIDKDEMNEYNVGDKKEPKVMNTVELTQAFFVQGTPNIIIFDKNWNKIFQLPGYASPTQVQTLLEFVDGLHNNTYKIQDWQKYIEEKGI